MLRTMVQAGCVAMMLAAVGCKGMLCTQGLPQDPLFANRKPIESKAITGPPEPVPHVEPTPPINPYAAERIASIR
jgi:hypothetical protein